MTNNGDDWQNKTIASPVPPVELPTILDEDTPRDEAEAARAASSGDAELRRSVLHRPELIDLDLVGELVDNRFEVMELLAEGGMAQVYLARQLSVDRVVALKVFRSEEHQDLQGARRFEHEARAAGRLASSHTVTVHDFGRMANGLLYIAMEYVDGQPLSRLIRTEGPFDVARAVALSAQLLESLAEAHANGIVHRDVKPHNILVKRTASGREIAKLTDFGIARFDSDELDAILRRDGILVGTPQYVSPEQVRNEEVDGRADLYSLSIVLYEMLTGRPPFHSQTAAKTLVQHLEAAPRQLSLARTDGHVPSELERVVHWALAKEPGHRPSSAGEFRQALLDAVAGRPVDAPASESEERTTMLAEGDLTSIAPLAAAAASAHPGPLTDLELSAGSTAAPSARRMPSQTTDTPAGGTRAPASGAPRAAAAAAAAAEGNSASDANDAGSSDEDSHREQKTYIFHVPDEVRSSILARPASSAPAPSAPTVAGPQAASSPQEGAPAAAQRPTTAATPAPSTPAPSTPTGIVPAPVSPAALSSTGLVAIGDSPLSNGEAPLPLEVPRRKRGWMWAAAAILAVAGAAIWWFVIRPPAAPPAQTQPVAHAPVEQGQPDQPPPPPLAVSAEAPTTPEPAAERESEAAEAAELPPAPATELATANGEGVGTVAPDASRREAEGEAEDSQLPRTPSLTRVVSLDSIPTGAFVVEEGRKLGRTPFPVRLDGAARTFLIRLAHHKEQTVVVDGESPDALMAELTPK